MITRLPIVSTKHTQLALHWDVSRCQCTFGRQPLDLCPPCDYCNLLRTQLHHSNTLEGRSRLNEPSSQILHISSSIYHYQMTK
ncbi:hypothetical protein HanPI659440_Chr12g0445861 [Helianthus annuus]|nr:hypothetical protein HanPI659440_Chr12g0445861 [Helianthus annuus]